MLFPFFPEWAYSVPQRPTFQRGCWSWNRLTRRLGQFPLTKREYFKFPPKIDVDIGRQEELRKMDTEEEANGFGNVGVVDIGEMNMQQERESEKLPSRSRWRVTNVERTFWHFSEMQEWARLTYKYSIISWSFSCFVTWYEILVTLLVCKNNSQCSRTIVVNLVGTHFWRYEYCRVAGDGMPTPTSLPVVRSS